MVVSRYREDNSINSIYTTVDRLQIRVYSAMYPIPPDTLPRLHAAVAHTNSEDLMAFVNDHSQETSAKLMSILNRRDLETGMSALHVAVKANSLKNVEMLISLGVDVSQVNNDGLNSAHLSVLMNNKPMLELILRKSIKNPYDRYGFTHLHAAGLLNDPLLIHKYLNIENTPNHTILTPPPRPRCKQDMLAIWPVRTRNHWQETNLVYDLPKDHQLLFAGYTPLHFAVEQGNIDSVEELLTNPNLEINRREFRGFSALHLACALTDEYLATAIVHMLLVKGANVATRTNSGATPLHVATYMGYDAIVVLLLTYGADANVWENWDNVTPLHLAARNLMAETVHLLLVSGADGQRKDKKKRTALHWMVAREWCYDINSSIEIKKNKAISCNLYDDIIQWLLAADCDINARDLWGRTAMHTAIKFHNACAVQRLERWGPDLEIYDCKYNTVKEYNKWETMWCTTCLSIHPALSIKAESEEPQTCN